MMMNTGILLSLALVSGIAARSLVGDFNSTLDDVKCFDFNPYQTDDLSKYDKGNVLTPALGPICITNKHYTKDHIATGNTTSTPGINSNATSTTVVHPYTPQLDKNATSTPKTGLFDNVTFFNDDTNLYKHTDSLVAAVWVLMVIIIYLIVVCGIACL